MRWLDGREFEQIPGDSEGCGNLVSYSSRGRGVGRELATEQHFYSALVGVSSCHFFFKFLAVPRGMWDLSSPARDLTHTPCHGSTKS